MKDQSLRVSMVEDSENDALFMIRELKKGRYNPVYELVKTASAMKKDLEEKQWNIILCDYSLPKFNAPSAIAVLKESNRELEAFSYSVSHDLRAPLRTIDGFGKALLEDCEDKLDSYGRHYLYRIIAATGNMALLIEDMLKLSKITRTEMDIVPVNLSTIAKSIKDELQRSQPERPVNFIIAENMEDSADPGLIRIIIENLPGRTP